MGEISNDVHAATVPLMPQEPTFGDRLKALRRSLKLTQDGLAEATVDLTRVDISRLESGWNKGNSHRVRVALARAFSVPVDELTEYLEGNITMEAVTARAAERDARESIGPLSSERFPNRGHGAEICIAGGVDPQAVRSVLDDTVTEDRTVLAWIQEMLAREARMRRSPTPAPFTVERPIAQRAPASSRKSAPSSAPSSAPLTKKQGK